ncbi:ubiquinone/menaquinone biosynthesis protein [Thermoplasmatales archaeon SM1-50]|nr:MAG: ubiquinone/menaquinone biosynthesis protein [Thermoplasmatales archaeon SM1-50]
MASEYRFITQETWDAIAESFDTTRQKPWNFCLDFIDSLNQKDVAADIGCGNGRHLIPLANTCSSVFGVDISMKLLRIVQKKLRNSSLKNVSLIHTDAVQLPFAKECLDVVLLIASLHNIQGKIHRITALKEIFRVLKSQGIALISVWSRWQDRYFIYFLKQFFVHTREFGDIDIYWRQHTLDIPRFYHLYSNSEFSRELQQVGFQIQQIKSIKIHSKRFPDNYFAIVRKR